MAVKFCVSCSFIFNLSATSGKYSFVVFPLHVCVHFLCHFFALFPSRSFITTLFGILLYLSGMFLFVAALFANVSANSFPLMPACAFTQQSVIFQSLFFISVIFLLISSAVYVCILLFCSLSSVVWLSVYIVALLSMVSISSMCSRAVKIANCSA